MELITKNDSRPAAKPTNKECTICRQSFLNIDNLKKHFLRKHPNEKDKIFQCTECFETKQLVNYFPAKRLLNKHIKEDHGPSSFKCQVCLKTFNSSSHFTIHKRSHSQTARNRYKCHLCTKAFLINGRLQSHLFNVHKQKLENVNYFKCELCSREFLSRSALETHVVKTHVVDKAFECPVCIRKFISQEDLEKHVKSHDERKSHVCNLCSKGYTRKNTLVSHLGIKHGHFFYCEMCLTPFKNKPEFDAHISDSKPELQCYLCQQRFISECHLKTHTDSHVQEIKTVKKECSVDQPTELLDTDELIKIKLEPSEDLNLEKFQCELCSKSFDREAYFHSHQNLIHPNAEWKCNFEQCSKSFKKYNVLKLHKLRHSKTKLFVCNICQKPFHHPENLRNHKICHDKEKQHKCEHCPSTSRTPSALRIHIAVKHGGPKLFKCPQVDCGTSWADSSRLKAHLKTHQTYRPFKCDLCTPISAFKTLPHLKNHQHKVHLNTKKIPTDQSLTAKYFDAVVFVCSSKMCSFETRSEIEVALHYNEKHELPKLMIFRYSFLSSSPLLSSVLQKTDRMIQKRYKCKVCFNLFEFPSKFSQHLETHTN